MPAAVAPARRSDAQLDELTLRRAQRGDERAWADLVERYQRPVHALLERMLAGRPWDRVQDLAQDTFVRVHRALPRFDPGGPASLSTWMLTIAARLALNELRVRELRAPALAPEPIAPERDRADAAIDRARLGATIARCMAALPDGQRAILVLRDYHDLDYQDIADILELELGTVKSRLSRARTALRALLVVAMPELGERHG
jgi:RNA polymerase sigma-70 factor (ECF subfamily)